MEWNRENRSFVISELDEETSFLNSCHYCLHSLCEKWRGTPKGKAKGLRSLLVVEFHTVPLLPTHRFKPDDAPTSTTKAGVAL
jgi:hypothetical protein